MTETVYRTNGVPDSSGLVAMAHAGGGVSFVRARQAGCWPSDQAVAGVRQSIDDLLAATDPALPETPIVEIARRLAGQRAPQAVAEAKASLAVHADHEDAGRIRFDTGHSSLDVGWFTPADRATIEAAHSLTGAVTALENLVRAPADPGVRAAARNAVRTLGAGREGIAAG